MAAQDSAESREGRRRFLYQLGVFGVGGVFSLLLGIPVIGYFLAALFQETSEQWVRVCALDEIDSLVPRQFRIVFKGENAWTDHEIVRGVFVIRKGSEILAFTNVCTHMECPVRWLDWRQQILCPCHGGMYDRWGNLLGGPPAHSLPLYVSRIQGNNLYVANRTQFRV